MAVITIEIEQFFVIESVFADQSDVFCRKFFFAARADFV